MFVPSFLLVSKSARLFSNLHLFLSGQVDYKVALPVLDDQRRDLLAGIEES